MKFSLAASALAAATFAGLAQADLDPIVVKGSKFFYKTSGKQFFMKGVAYQTNPDAGTEAGTSLEPTKFKDPLADAKACKRDIPMLEELKTNVIRVYAIEPKSDHSECMSLLEKAGIYVVADLSEPSLSVNRDDPSWDDKLYARYTSVVDEMAKYTNTMGFFAGNEVSNNVTNSNASPFVKAAVRDTKAYIKEKNYRSIPVGYATNDDPEIRLNLAHYMNCGTEEESIDFWGYNIYSWCGDSSYTESGYDQRTAEYENYSKPVFLAEYGCNEVRPRKFTDVKALYDDTMTEVWSGGIVYMYFEEDNKYGLVTVDGTEVTPNSDFKNLKSQITKAEPKGVTMKDYSPTNTKLETCPKTGKEWKASATLPPTPNQDTCDCMVKSLECAPKGNVSAKKAAELFGYICGDGDADCTGIAVDGAEGKYGPYSMCGTNEKLAYVMNKYYEKNDKGSDACDFEGVAEVKEAETDSECTKLTKDAEENSDTPASGSGSTPGGSSSGGDSAESEEGDESAASMVRVGSSAIAAAALLGAALIMA